MATSKLGTKRSAPSMTTDGSSPEKEARIVAIDPGEIHVGVALFLGDKCYEAYEVTPDELFKRLETWLEGDAIDVLVVESFQLYEDKAMDQVGSEMGTCECIGVIKYLHSRLAGPGVTLVMQPAGIKEATASILRRKKRVSLAKSRRAGGHAFDAELHGWKWIMTERQRRGEPV